MEVQAEMKSAMEGVTKMICVREVATEVKATMKEIHGISNKIKSNNGVSN